MNLNFVLAGKKRDVDLEARFLSGRRDGWMERGVWGFGRHCAMTEKVHLERSYPIDDRESLDEMREGGGGVEPDGNGG